MKFLKKAKFLIATVAVVLGLNACSMGVPISATSNPVGSKVGTAEGMGLFMGLTFYGNALIKEAAKNGGITKISTVDFKVMNYVGIYQTYTCIVTGE